MIRWNVDQLRQKIKEEKGLSEEEIDDKINEKLAQLSGLISKDGAAHIIATELGINLAENKIGRVKIKNVLAGMKNVEILGKVMAKYEIREFSTEKRSGKVGSIMVGDETGALRIVFWNDKTDDMEKIKENDVILLNNLYVRENNGRLEAHMGEGGTLEISPPNESIGEVSTNVRSDIKRKKISELLENENNVELFGTVVESYDPHFFEVCSDCGKRAPDKGDGPICPAHGKVIANYSYVMNVVLDDGSSNIRCVFFRDQLRELLKYDEEKMLSIKGSEEEFAKIKHELLGNVIKVQGRTTKNQMFDRLEFAVSQVFTDPDPGEEIESLSKELGQKSMGSSVKEEPKPVEHTSNLPESTQKASTQPEQTKSTTSQDDVPSLEDIDEIEEDFI